MKYNATTANREVSEGRNPTEENRKYFTIPHSHIQTFWIVEEVLDGDSLKVKQEFTQERCEIRLYGLDAPEVHFSRKMREDEVKSGIPASLLLQYGLLSLDYVLQVCPPGTRITLITELENRTDFWLRDLAYVILPSGECLNELLIKNGFAKASHSYYCSLLPEYQTLNFQAKQNKAGIYLFIDVF
ncbi:thermonuclease family protein [Chryseobacterium suipulveris]|uniref:Thermonuclease family protein n=1 Tax=Chryseobacterium suipulveris TaxID=2929800 RepID=A0ABY4BTB5_9FLAO|nr:thermonuclease family protein [Chryseobacterium suipulveris]UOE42144.1 thermonuclease family protein [Chryseobacterium suipulveris]